MDEPSKQTDEEFWAEHDPFGDRFSRRVPWWVALVAAATLALAGYLLFSR
jgi:type VI protein secretion system component VasF